MGLLAGNWFNAQSRGLSPGHASYHASAQQILLEDDTTAVTGPPKEYQEQRYSFCKCYLRPTSFSNLTGSSEDAF